MKTDMCPVWGIFQQTELTHFRNNERIPEIINELVENSLFRYPSGLIPIWKFRGFPRS